MIGKITNRIGIPASLFYGYIGLVFFMIGAGIETSWFSAFLVSSGYEIQLVSVIFSLYGLFVAIFSWLTSFFVNIFSVRKVMIAGLIIYLVSAVILIAGIYFELLPVIAVAYTLRGASYPLFAYAFLIWITLRSEFKNLGKATSWFWFSFNLGLTIISPLLASLLLKFSNSINILAVGMVMALLGSFLSLKVNRDHLPTFNNNKSILYEMQEGIMILFEYPRLAIGLVVKAINNIGQFGFVIMMPIFLVNHGYSLSQWGIIWATTYVVNSFAGILFGNLGDYYGWRKIVCYFSGTLTALSCFLIGSVVFYFPGNFFLLMLAFIVFSFGIAAFGPLSALIPAMALEKKTTALSVLNLGSGLSNFLGPVLVTVLFQKFDGFFVLAVFAVLYLLASILAIFLKTPEELKKVYSLKEG
ncbi:RbtT/DalT/CsbX family MFS transporter [Carnobacterium maltaromaticum]|jgi:MFS family permease|uniref:Major Facilitator Superfamily protein n=1 Tax=Carnobacterium maltaromaticum LMA28 TaxID=1234679 RepID=K8E6U1_CARML|nr:RbtT/DalT/CsbX family MFS transporter [Carnobacterium maltaromaticum]AOA03118.1 MFS transporter [Carnobacterium maltaromaticum]KRN64293.1 major facilitator superfamily protein [Carnobacterium maltaromaticum DSM 20342]MCI1817654.1 RbtT/DalT/CsbX family MFS transporter [Carnobacterium maltaromaticum]MDW5524540.1 RbtT/DalT/CsbX family MFS transporter [Carnobacterium maltaromaticum]CCO12544.2 major Facilitator Superfamily protein [Carnobacterium maltaromaticum LMA28]